MNGNKIILIFVLVVHSLGAVNNDLNQNFKFKVEKKVDSSKKERVLPPFLLIPVDTSFDTIFIDSNKSQIKIGLCLPLLLDSVYSDEDFENSLFITNKLIRGAFDFYCGAHLAFDSFKNIYPFIELHLFDSSIDTFNIDSLIQNEKLAQMDIIIGPLLDKYFKKILNFCHRNKIYAVSPSKNLVLNPNPFYRKSTAPISSYYDSIAVLLHNKFDSLRKKVIISQDFDNAKIIALNKKFNSVPNSKKLVSSKPFILEILDSSTIDVIDDSIIYKLGRLDHRIIFINSTDESFVYKVFSELDKVKDSIHFTVIGLPNWENFKSIDISFYNNFNVIFGSTFYVNYKDPVVTKFRTKYIQNFKMEPSKFSFLGYDNTFFTIEGLISPSQDFNWKGLSSSYRLIKQPLNNGQHYKENSYFHLLQFLFGQIVKLQ